MLWKNLPLNLEELDLYSFHRLGYQSNKATNSENKIFFGISKVKGRYVDKFPE